MSTNGSDYRWRADRAVDYPYVKDDVDVAAFNLYAQRGFLPSTRPNGFLDADEQASWQRWREKASCNERAAVKVPGNG